MRPRRFAKSMPKLRGNRLGLAIEVACSSGFEHESLLQPPAVKVAQSKWAAGEAAVRWFRIQGAIFSWRPHHAGVHSNNSHSVNRHEHYVCRNCERHERIVARLHLIVDLDIPALDGAS